MGRKSMRVVRDGLSFRKFRNKFRKKKKKNNSIRLTEIPERLTGIPAPYKRGSTNTNNELPRFAGQSNNNARRESEKRIQQLITMPRKCDEYNCNKVINELKKKIELLRKENINYLKRISELHAINNNRLWEYNTNK